MKCRGKFYNFCFQNLAYFFSSQKMDEFNLKLAQYCSNKIFEVLYLGDFKMDVIKW